LAVSSIGDGAFSGITNLISITIPSSVTGIGNGVFSGCVNLIEVYFKGNAPSNVGLNLFSGTSNSTVYYQPQAWILPILRINKMEQPSQ
jgi:BspA type Leucine rich repeat region (6 copies)